MLSRRHARFIVCAHGVVVEDLDSTNGVYVDGERIVRSRLLVGGEFLRLGSTELLLVPNSTDRKERCSKWDDETVGPRRTVSSGQLPVTEGADVFDVLSDLAERALRTGDPARAERIIRGHIERLSQQVRSEEDVDETKVPRAISLSLRLAEATHSGQWLQLALGLYTSARRRLPGLASVSAPMTLAPSPRTTRRFVDDVRRFESAARSHYTTPVKSSA